MVKVIDKQSYWTYEDKQWTYDNKSFTWVSEPLCDTTFDLINNEFDITVTSDKQSDTTDDNPPKRKIPVRRYSRVNK